MIVSRFLLWAQRASPGHRAEAVTALANAFLYSDLSAADRAEAEIGLTAMLEDSSVLVRASMAAVLASSPAAPRHVIVALAGDTNQIAALVLARSPVLSDGDLVDMAAFGDAVLQCAIALRSEVSAAVSAALAEVGTADALVALIRNGGAEIAEFSLARMVERHGSNAVLREALLGRDDLPVDITQAVVASLAADLGRFVTGCGWLSPERSGRITQDARERTTVVLSARADEEGAVRLVDHLRRSGQLTPGLILRSILSRGIALAEAAFTDLSKMPARRVSAILCDGRSSAFRALYARAGFPDGLRPAFEAALAAWRETGAAPHAAPGLSCAMVRRVLAICEALPHGEAGRIVAFLRRFEVEAAIDEARRAASDLASEAAVALAVEYAAESATVLIDARDRLVA